MNPLRIALAQLNPTVGDIDGNAARIAAMVDSARAAGARLVAFPELAVTGYPPEDLIFHAAFRRRNREALARLAAATGGITAIVGFVDGDERPQNAAAILHDGAWVATYHKVHLPNYGVFDEVRYFRPGREALLLCLEGRRVGVSICEDIWHEEGPSRALGLAGAALVVNINASPYDFRKGHLREEVLAARATRHGYFLAYVNTVGGQDELVFDGQSLVMGAGGQVIARARAFEEDLLLWDLELPVEEPAGAGDRGADEAPPGVRLLDLSPLPAPAAPLAPSLVPRQAAPPDPLAEAYGALVLGTRDYVRKNGFEQVVLGLSGGIDSALVAYIAVDALGAENVRALFMPSRYTSRESREDAAAVAANLDIPLTEVSIDAIFQAYLDELAPSFAGLPEDTTEENIQARIRGNLLMALSNKFNWLVLSTGDKSEMSVGFTTLYGDMAGGFAVIKDVPKTLVYQLVRYRNGIGPAVPERVLTKPPSPELKAGQKASDTLPPYEVLDPILKAYVEENAPAGEIVAMGFAEDLVRRVIRLVDLAEYKRRQAPPGVKISPRAFGRDRRMPITNRFRAW